MNDSLLETIAENVHMAWAAEKRRQGFTDHPWKFDITLLGDSKAGDCFTFDDSGRRCRVAPDKHHTNMLPYADLPENIKEYDRATTRAVLDVIAVAGYRVMPADKVRQIQNAVALLNSMLFCGESHSETSKAVVREALGS